MNKVKLANLLRKKYGNKFLSQNYEPSAKIIWNDEALDRIFLYSLIIIICSLHVMMDPAHTKAINATAVTIVLTAAMNIIAVSIDVEKLLSHPLLAMHFKCVWRQSINHFFYVLFLLHRINCEASCKSPPNFVKKMLKQCNNINKKTYRFLL